MVKVVFALVAIFVNGNSGIGVQRIGTYANYHQCAAQAAVIEQSIKDVVNSNQKVVCIPVNQ